MVHIYESGSGNHDASWCLWHTNLNIDLSRPTPFPDTAEVCPPRDGSIERLGKSQESILCCWKRGLLERIWTRLSEISHPQRILGDLLKQQTAICEQLNLLMHSYLACSFSVYRHLLDSCIDSTLRKFVHCFCSTAYVCHASMETHASNCPSGKHCAAFWPPPCLREHGWQ